METRSFITSTYNLFSNIKPNHKFKRVIALTFLELKANQRIQMNGLRKIDVIKIASA